MTGFGSAEGRILGQLYRMELRSVNHRFLDLKVRLPRELSGFDAQIRSAVQGRFARGSIELKIERAASEPGLEMPSEAPPIQVNLARARQVLEALQLLKSHLGISEPVTLREISQFPDVIQLQDGQASAPSESWTTELEPLVRAALDSLSRMRQTEGMALARILAGGMDEISALLGDITSRRGRSESEIRARVAERINRVFEAHPIADSAVRAVLEARIAQELALLLDRTDIQEELHRFEGHIGHFRKTLAAGQQLGRKLEFILQELGREINTLGNKAQDLGISEQVVAIKVRLEQLREQVLNLE